MTRLRKKFWRNLQVHDMMNEFNSMIIDIIDIEEDDTKVMKNIPKKIKKLNKYNEMEKSIIRFFDKYNRENLMYIINHKEK